MMDAASALVYRVGSGFVVVSLVSRKYCTALGFNTSDSPMYAQDEIVTDFCGRGT